MLVAQKCSELNESCPSWKMGDQGHHAEVSAMLTHLRPSTPDRADSEVRDFGDGVLLLSNKMY